MNVMYMRARVLSLQCREIYKNYLFPLSICKLRVPSIYVAHNDGSNAINAQKRCANYRRLLQA
jgi:hypothetical protein